MKLDLRGSKVSLTATGPEGHDITLTGNVKDARIEVEHNHENGFDDFDNKFRFKADKTYRLEFEPDSSGSIYKLKINSTEVDHTARIEVASATVSNIEAARKKAGAPESAVFKMLNLGDSRGGLIVFNPNEKVTVEFSWKENV